MKRKFSAFGKSTEGYDESDKTTDNMNSGKFDTLSVGNYSFPTSASTTGYVLTTNGPNQPATWNSVSSGGGVTSVGMSVPSFLSVSPSTITTSGTFAVSLSGTALPVANGGTGVTTSSGANSVVLRDANQNVFANNFINNIATYVSSGTTITLTVSSASYIVITGTSTQKIVFPDATTLTVGQTFLVNNNSTLSASIYANDGTTSIKSTPSGGCTEYVLTANGTTNGTWDTHSYLAQTTTSGTSLFNSSSAIQTSSTFNLQSGSNVIYISGAYSTGNYNFNLPAAAGSSGQVLTSQGGGSTAMTWTTPTTGTVTSVGVTVPSFMSVSPSTITTSGTFAITASSTGTGNVVLSAAPTLTGTVTAGQISNTSSNLFLDSTYGVSVGYNTTKSSAISYPHVIYNNSTDRTQLMTFTSAGTSSGINAVIVGAPTFVLSSSAGLTGKVTLGTGGTVTVANTSVTSNTIVFVQYVSFNGAQYLETSVTAGTGFTITSSSASDRSQVAYMLINSA